MNHVVDTDVLVRGGEVPWLGLDVHACNRAVHACNLALHIWNFVVHTWNLVVHVRERVVHTRELVVHTRELVVHTRELGARIGVRPSLFGVSSKPIHSEASGNSVVASVP